MFTCKDCAHYEVCFDFTHLKYSKNLPDNREDVCDHFKNKADFVEVVRCKDCTYCSEHYNICHYGVGRDVKPDHYCSYGERRCEE